MKSPWNRDGQSSAKAEKEKVVKVREDKKRMTYQEKQEWGIEGDIEALENRIVAIEEEMQANGSDFGKLATLQKELDEKTKHPLWKNTNAMNI